MTRPWQSTADVTDGPGVTQEVSDVSSFAASHKHDWILLQEEKKAFSKKLREQDTAGQTRYCVQRIVWSRSLTTEHI